MRVQAMDRAHRLGQRRTVSVYRVLTRGTLEERIMGLQRFKLDTAAAVVNADNASLASMDAPRILDLLSLQPGGATPGGPAAPPQCGAALAHPLSHGHFRNHQCLRPRRAGSSLALILWHLMGSCQEVEHAAWTAISTSQWRLLPGCEQLCMLHDWRGSRAGCAHAGDAEAAAAAAAGDAPGGKGGMKAVLEGLGELWDEQQYAEELSLDAFMARLK